MNEILTIILEIDDTVVIWAFTHFPTIASVVTLMIITGWLSWWGRGRFIDYRNQFYKVRNDCDQLNDNQVQLNSNQLVFNKGMIRIEKKLDRLIIHLQSTKKIDRDLFKSQSPIELTEVGYKILVAMGGKSFVDNHLDRLAAQVEEQNFKSGLDVENYCSQILNDCTSDDDFLPVKDFIFKNPVYKVREDVAIALDLIVAISIMAIYLRNQFFSRNPE